MSARSCYRYWQVPQIVIIVGDNGLLWGTLRVDISVYHVKTRNHYVLVKTTRPLAPRLRAFDLVGILLPSIVFIVVISYGNRVLAVCRFAH
jgi:hypothetical protein